MSETWKPTGGEVLAHGSMNGLWRVTQPEGTQP